ncbi:MAG: lytic transglycosylase domain-containing protein [Bacteroidetes bacterium]|nr:lytic transglycosylase domain-containing protein [Bacteroidota bacterium]
MQYRCFLIAFTFTVISLHASAQMVKIGSSHKKEAKTDTIITLARKNKAVPAALPIDISMPKTYVPKPKVFKGVPLANEKAYYGEMSDYVNQFVMKYLSAHNRTLNVVQNRSNTEFPLIDNVLQKHEMPKELKYLAVIESALNHNAVSRVGAVGPWQFMAPTARLMGLKVSKRNDERRDMYKSTNAAAKYLTTLYEDLNDWLLVVAAYNSGPTPVKRAMERTGSNNFWDIKQYLPKETQGHVLAFIATATIFENLSKLISKPIDDDDDDDPTANATANPVTGIIEKQPKVKFTPDELKNMAIVKISEPLSMDLMIQELGLEKGIMDRWNHDYEVFEYGNYPTETYNLRLPKEKLDKFIEKKELLYKKSRQVFSAQNM